MTPYIPYYIAITKFNNNRIEVKYIHDRTREDDIDSAYEHIIEIYKKELLKYAKILNDEYDWECDYETFVKDIWFKGISTNAHPINYSLFVEGKWNGTWTPSELYNKVCDIVYDENYNK
jgi:hypothetical protein